MMEQSQPSESHRHAILVTSCDHFVICHRATWLGNELDAQLRGMVNRVTEREEGVGGDCHSIQPLQELCLILLGQRCRWVGEALLPLLKLHGVHVAFNEADPCVDAILTLHTLLERQRHDFRMKSQLPSSNLPTCKLDAIHAALLPGADANHHAV